MNKKILIGGIVFIVLITVLSAISLNNANAEGVMATTPRIMSQSTDGIRSPKTIRDFAKQNPCPAVGVKKGTCPGYKADHWIPLCAGGADVVGNLHWQPSAPSYVKDAEEHAMCNTIKNMGVISTDQVDLCNIAKIGGLKIMEAVVCPLPPRT